MLFSSPEFIFLFLPVAVILHFALARRSINAAIVGTTVSSLVFYAWWNPPYVVLPVLSIVANFYLAHRIVQSDKSTAKYLLIFGIVANVLVLCHYKYTDFLFSIVDGHKAMPPNVPLALSFTTFVQIAFLVHVHKRHFSPDFRQYALFVAFFPHLIAGPIVRWSNLGHQLSDKARYRLDWANIALGLTVFTCGLAKKVLLADQLSPYIGQLFDAAARGEPLTGAAVWAANAAFTAQIYFDFSGYSDMAVGLGLLFNFRLPINFAAPLRAQNIGDLWRRWHITLSRLARDLIYVPLCLGHDGQWRRSAALMLTMMVIGVWHGAGWTFVVWGAYNGVLLLIFQFWQAFWGTGKKSAAGRLLGWALTFVTFSSGAVFFRAPDIATSWHLILAMFGFGDVTVPATIVHPLDDWGVRHGYFPESFLLTWFGANWSMVATIWTTIATAIMLFVPDTMELVDYREGDAQSNWRRSLGPLAWHASPATLCATAVLFAVTFVQLGRVSEFLYYQF
jgi:alginate O-acetyltransferase complex protein AlgI